MYIILLDLAFVKLNFIDHEVKFRIMVIITYDSTSMYQSFPLNITSDNQMFKVENDFLYDQAVISCFLFNCFPEILTRLSMQTKILGS